MNLTINNSIIVSLVSQITCYEDESYLKKMNFIRQNISNDLWKQKKTCGNCKVFSSVITHI